MNINRTSGTCSVIALVLCMLSPVAGGHAQETRNGAPQPARAGSPETAKAAPLPPIPFNVGIVDTPATLSERISRPAVAPIVPPPVVTAPSGAPVAGAVPANPLPPAPTVASGCSGNSLSEMFSPACLEVLGTLGPVSRPAQNGTSGTPAMSGNVSCGVSVITAGHASVTSFATQDLASCLKAGARFGWGVSGITNIVASTSSGVSAVTCVRSADAPTAVTCRQQP